MYLLVDCGNTSVNLATYESGSLRELGSASEWQAQCRALVAEHAVKGAVVASVRGALETEYVVGFLRAIGLAVDMPLHTKASAFGLQVAYEQPQRLGVDRWLAMLGGLQLVPTKRGVDSYVVVDAGTAMTVDWVHAGQHQGGYIVPGLRMAASALNQKTQGINAAELVSHDERTAWGLHTEGCVYQGVLRTAVALLRDIQHELLTVSDGNCEFYICGGDANVLLGALSGRWQYQPLMVFNGMLVAAGVVTSGESS